MSPKPSNKELVRAEALAAEELAKTKREPIRRDRPNLTITTRIQNLRDELELKRKQNDLFDY